MTDSAQEPPVDEGGRVVFPGISSRAFEHPADGAALTAMRAVPGFDQLLKLASSLLRERQYRLVYLASSVRVGPRQFSDLDALLGEVCGVLDAPERPEFFVYNDPEPNAITLGVDRPFIALSSGLYEITSEDERRVIVGHELGHAMSGHSLYQSMLQHLLNLLGSVGFIPIGGLGLRALIAALREWQRKAELSGDRAGLLAAQDEDASLRVFMKLAGGAHLDQIDADAFLEQAADYESSGDLRDGVLKLLNTERNTHPFAVVRAAELRRWASSPEYAAILAGDYPRREDDSSASFTDSAREAARTYKARIDESTDPLVGAVRNFGSSVGTAADSVFDWISRRARGPEPHGDQPADEQPDGDAGESGDSRDSGTSDDGTPRGDDPSPGL
ncbi:M48 family metallopeptidase [Jatrophihabitans endophyticus]|uniref:M48 family metallopeptidase n=1 Tax=Jatrophihabitans endophyticus TaxID=1206085 RepID=UPI0019E141BD|nr:M48 family metallopeptidase [Jatrophihabitans endophyticus]MBE7188164.1 M48 family metallopeptidase [Jatrophihabitans endophyticus]